MRTKKTYQKPMMESETFVPNDYIAVCVPTGDWTVDENAPVLPNFHGYLDANKNGILDQSEKDKKNEVGSDNSWNVSSMGLPDDGPWYAFDQTTENRVVFWISKPDAGSGRGHGVGYSETYVNKTNVS